MSFGIEIGVGSKIGDSVFAGAALAIAIWSIVESVKWVKSHKDRRPEFLADLDGGEVNEITHQFTAVKVFQEQEHGGLFYFLKTIEDRVFVLYDDESQDLGVQGENPMESEFRPKTILHMAQAPRTKFVLSREFSGDPLTVGETHDLLVSPESWPESDSFCRTRWDNLEKRFSQPRKKN
ncbi:MAG: hypothetical protein P1U58_17920 [Verrucomicrobiales bacterium]|nr:hypothetical protein [Verrucomicrobiales bacterium]